MLLDHLGFYPHQISKMAGLYIEGLLTVMNLAALYTSLVATALDLTL
jgi:hypothetical protein